MATMPISIATNRLWPTSAFDIVTNATLAYQTGPLGAFYQPTNSPLINKGSTNANLLGLYHYTVLTNLVNGLEIKETNSIVDIGYHYVAADAYGNPFDTNSNGIPDCVEDANGNGLWDNGETPWTLAILTQPHWLAQYQGKDWTFIVTVGGVQPISYQWYFNNPSPMGMHFRMSKFLYPQQYPDQQYGNVLRHCQQ